MIEDRDVTIAEAAEIFGVSKAKLYRMARDDPDPKKKRQLWPVQVLRSRGRTGGVAYYRLSEVAARLAEEHEERHADRAPSAEPAPSVRPLCNN